METLASYFGGLVLFAFGMVLIVIGRARDGRPQPFLKSYPIGVAYTMTTMALLVFGASWIVIQAFGLR